jgi:hypothetical protein
LYLVIGKGDESKVKPAQREALSRELRLGARHRTRSRNPGQPAHLNGAS